MCFIAIFFFCLIIYLFDFFSLKLADKIKSSIKNDFYNVNIEKIEILKDDGLINQISYLSFQELLNFDKNYSLNEVKINKTNKILTISLN